MKGEYVLEEKKDLSSSNSNKNSMFGAKLHPHHHQHQSPQNFQQNPSHHHHHQQHNPSPNFHHPAFQLTRECQTSEEADSTTHHMSPTDRPDPLNPQPVSTVGPPQQHQPPSSIANDGATIEVVRRPRGRPPGSKNKPKPPVIITRDAEPSMSPYILEIPIGVDIINSITKFCRRRNMGLCVLNGSGTVTNVTLRQPSTTPVSTVTFHGRFDILSISATIVQPHASVPSNNGIANGFTISLAGPQGQVVGGGVVGPLVTAEVFLHSKSKPNSKNEVGASWHGFALKFGKRGSYLSAALALTLDDEEIRDFSFISAFGLQFLAKMQQVELKMMLDFSLHSGPTGILLILLLSPLASLVFCVCGRYKYEKDSTLEYNMWLG